MHASSNLFRRRLLNLGVIVALLLAAFAGSGLVLANNTAQSLPFSQDWSNTGLITTSDDWSGVPGIIGFRGDNLTSVNDVDPQTVLADETTVDVNANQTDPNTFITGGVAEFDGIANPVVALQGSGTADAPFILLHLNTTGQMNITVAYNLRDIDGSLDNAAQQVALQFRIGSSGNFTNIPAGYVADATTGPSLATLVTPVSVVLPAAANNQPLVQVRMITTNASGSDEWVGVDDISVTGTPIVAETAPAVVSTTPGGGATNVARDANITINFSEPVDVTGNWFTISCATSGAHTATVSGGPTTFTLNPDADFASNELCTVTIVANQVTDQDTDDPPDNMAANHVFSYTTTDVQICGDPATLIHDIQGSGLVSPLSGVVTIEGVVVGDYQASGQFSGYHVQEENADADGDPATSEGIFVFNTSFPVNIGDKVRVRGTITEFGSAGATLTELASVSSRLVCSTGNALPTATSVTLPVASLNDWEAFEGMRISIAQDLTVTENFTLGRFGEVALSVNGRLLNPTSVTTPGAAAIALQDLNNRSRILLDDGNNQQNIDPTLYPAGGLSANNTLRSGYTVNGLTGVLEQRFGVYRVQPVGLISFDADNPRPAAPDAVGGRIKVSAMNVLNYFTTIDTGAFICGPSGGLECRGADSAFEFTRQRDKIISATLGLDADVVGLMEIENNATAAVQDLVDGLNAATAPGTYSFIDTGTIGTDAIKVGLIYRAAKVTPVGAYAILDSTVDPTFIDTLNRPVLAQTFEENLTGERFTVAVNHLKSKGSACPGDPDTGDGQGNCNLTRTRAATALVNWLGTDPTGSGDTDFLIIGDLNSYAMEDPIAAIESAGYANLIDTFVGSDAYSFVFQGQSGYLDHALASPSLAAQATGATEWHINADEPIVLDYNLEFKSPNHQVTLYNPGPYRSSDHDPLVVGLNLDQTPPTLSVSVSPNVLWSPNHKYRTVNATVSVSDNVDPSPTLTLVSVTSSEDDNAPGEEDGNTTNDIVIVNDFRFRLRAERSDTGTGRIYTITYRATDAHGNISVVAVTVTVPYNQGEEE